MLQRFHKSEIAYVVALALYGVSGWLMFSAYSLVSSTGLPSEPMMTSLSRQILGAGVLMGVALLFSIFFMYPLIRTQAKEQGKLRAMTESLSARSETLEHAALTDPLTGMQNRRYFDDALKEYLEEFKRIDKPIGLMVLDLDHFKMVNDTHGHDVGDEVLRRVARCLQEFTRYHDIVARLGGEEFAVVAPNMDVDILIKFAERIRKAVAGLTIEAGNVSLRVTISLGLAVWDRKESPEEFYKRADKLLYQAKRQGRNRVCA